MRQMRDAAQARKRASVTDALWNSSEVHPDVAELFFLFAALGWLVSTAGLGLRFGFFHRLAGLFGTLGTHFGALLALFVKHLFASEQLDEGRLRAIALPPCGADNTRVATLAIAEARGYRIEQFVNRFVGHQVSRRLTAGRQITLLAESDHFFDQGPEGLGLGNGRLDALLYDHRSDQIAQQRAPVARVPA